MNIIAGNWNYKSDMGIYNEIPPDGCVDIIYSINSDGIINWHLTELPENTEINFIDENMFLEGIRFNPAAQIDAIAMLKYLNNSKLAPEEAIKNALEFVRIDVNLSDALLALGAIELNINQCAANLGVSIRSLQRLVFSKTGKTPNYWRQLSRARIAARYLFDCKNIAQTTYETGFADQPHFNRAMVKWFNRTPKQITDDKSFYNLISQTAYF